MDQELELPFTFTAAGPGWIASVDGANPGATTYHAVAGWMMRDGDLWTITALDLNASGSRPTYASVVFCPNCFREGLCTSHRAKR